MKEKEEKKGVKSLFKENMAKNLKTQIWGS